MDSPGYDPTISAKPSQDERLLAAVSHASIFVPTIGIVVPIVVWATQKDKSRFVTFQALQALAVQAAGYVFSTLGVACYMCSIFMPAFVTMSGQEITTAPNPMASIALPLSILLVTQGFSGVFAIYAIIACIALFRGQEFRYIFFANLVDDWLASRR